MPRSRRQSRVASSSPGSGDISSCCAGGSAIADSDPVQDADLEQHIGIVRIGNEPLNRWIMAAALLRPESLIQNLRR